MSPRPATVASVRLLGHDWDHCVPDLEQSCRDCVDLATTWFIGAAMALLEHEVACITLEFAVCLKAELIQEFMGGSRRLQTKLVGSLANSFASLVCWPMAALVNNCVLSVTTNADPASSLASGVTAVLMCDSPWSHQPDPICRVG